MKMIEVNIVSLWVGKLDNESDFERYISESYDGEGNMNSDFMSDFKIDFYDDQFKEVLFDESGLKELVFKNFSYSEAFVNLIPDLNFENFNSYILLFNFKYQEDVNLVNKFEYIGSFSYR